MWEILYNLPGWRKLTGAGVVSLVVILSLVYVYSGPEAVEIPQKLDDAKKEATTELVKATSEVAAESSKGIISSFRDAGESMAKTVDNPVAKITVSNGMVLVGVLLSLIIVISFASAVYGLLKP